MLPTRRGGGRESGPFAIVSLLNPGLCKRNGRDGLLGAIALSEHPRAKLSGGNIQLLVVSEMDVVVGHLVRSVAQESLEEIGGRVCETCRKAT